MSRFFDFFFKSASSSLRFKFSVSFILVSLVISLVIYIPYKRYLDDTWKKDMKNVMEMILLEYSILERTDYWIKQAEEKTPEFWDMCRTFDRIASAFDIKWIYTGRQLPGNKYQYIVSSGFLRDEFAENGVVRDCLKPIYDEETVPTLVESYKTGKFACAVIENEKAIEAWGNIATANILITNRLGDVCGFIGADYDISRINALKSKEFYSIVAALFLSLFVGLLLSYNLRITLINPLREMKLLADDMTQLRFDRIISKNSKSEIGDMQNAMIRARNNLKQMMQYLMNERNKLAAVKDHLRVGAFIMDKRHIIQEYYFRELEYILSPPPSGLTGDRIPLAGKNFIDIVKDSLTDKERESLINYFEMIISCNLNEDNLDKINPIAEFVYKIENCPPKTLRSTFARLQNTIDNEDGTTLTQVYILAGIEDVSIEAKLKKRIAEVQKQKQQEMRMLFEVFRIDHVVCNNITASAVQNLEEINRILQKTKNNQLDAGPALTTILQLIQTLKFDVITAGLESFGEKLQETESLIKSLQDKAVLPKTLTGLSAEVEKLTAEKNKLIKTMKTLFSYRNDKRNTEVKPSGLLAAAIQKTCDKLASDLKKRVVFFADELDVNDLTPGTRMELKGILIQIARNAVYHGIESPADRIAANKDESGAIHLSIHKIAPEGSQDLKTLEIKMSDDGRGIDFEAVRKKAIALGLLDEAAAQEANTAEEAFLNDIIFRPGFSTAGEVSMHAGRGIGLNLVRDRVLKLGGTVEVHTQKGCGSEFVIRF